MKKFPESTPGYLLPTTPFFFLKSANLQVLEFKEQNLIESISVTSLNISRVNREIYIGMNNKLAVIFIDNYSLLRQKTFEGIGNIIHIELTYNHKHLVLFGSLGKMLCINNSTLEVAFSAGSPFDKVISSCRVIGE